MREYFTISQILTKLILSNAFFESDKTEAFACFSKYNIIEIKER